MDLRTVGTSSTIFEITLRSFIRTTRDRKGTRRRGTAKCPSPISISRLRDVVVSDFCRKHLGALTRHFSRFTCADCYGHQRDAFVPKKSPHYKYRCSSNNAMRPTTKNVAAAISWARPDNSTLKRLKSHAVAGHALTPDSNANHPFVSGQGPSRTSNNKPPPPATIAQIQPATNARRGTAVRIFTPHVRTNRYRCFDVRAACPAVPSDHLRPDPSATRRRCYDCPASRRGSRLSKRAAEHNALTFTPKEALRRFATANRRIPGACVFSQSPQLSRLLH